MPYNLRGRSVRQDLLEDNNKECDNEECFGGNPSDEEADHVSEMSAEDSEYEVSSSDEELQNATLDKRILESRARGRPVSKLKGKNGFVWDMKAPERRSGMSNNHVFVRLYHVFVHLYHDCLERAAIFSTCVGSFRAKKFTAIIFLQIHCILTRTLLFFLLLQNLKFFSLCYRSF